MKKNRTHNYSIRTKLTCITIIVITSVVLICWLLNKTFLAKFYQQSKMDALGETYYYINEVFAKNSAQTEQDTINNEIDRICSISNSHVYVFDFNRNLIRFDDKTGINYIYPNYVSRQIREYNFSKLIKYLPEELKEGLTSEPLEDKNDDSSNLASDENKNNENADKESSNKKKNNGNQEAISGNKKIDDIDGLLKLSQSQFLEETDNYSIYKVLDTRINSYEIELIGTLDNGLYVYISSNFDSIKESVDISNKFLAYVGIGAVLFGFITMLFVSRSFSKPILDLAAIAKRMSELDFDAHYEVKTQDEIAQLGENMNFLSDKLKETITELKNANNELEKDIVRKNQIDEMRKEFLSNVSHELKTPIALIQGYAEGLIDNINDDEESRNFYLEVIVDEANKMNNMVKKLLDLNNIEFGDDNMSIERFDIVQVIKGVLESTKILIENKGAKLIFNYVKPVYVWADEYMIEEVITNYISNALNHLDGEKIIKIEIVQKENVIRVCVFNTGKTIPEEELDNIWIKFYKVDKARTREYGGNGVGLSIVKAIMNSHNKDCGVENKEDGVQFWFELDKTNLIK